jgi:proline dehydrogenase
VIQAYLRRSDQDLQRLLDAGISVRLVKGAYAEPPIAAFQKKDDVDVNFRKLAFRMLDSGIYHSIATHDEKMISAIKLYARQKDILREKYEIEMLLGIRKDLQKQLVADRYRVRVYVPYGEAWYPYFTRRLAERPANVWFLLSNLMR